MGKTEVKSKTITDQTITEDDLASDFLTGGMVRSFSLIPGVSGVTLSYDGTEPGAGNITLDFSGALLAGLAVKEPCRVCSTANIDLATGTLLTIDDIPLSAGDRVLVKDQTDPLENGIYVAATGAWSRSLDFDGTPGSEIVSGAFTLVLEGTAHQETQWVLTTTSPVLGVTPLVFTQFGVSGAISSLNGLTSATQTFSIDNTGTDFDITSGGSVHTFHVPEASPSVLRGMVSNLSQTFGGTKTFSNGILTSTLASTGLGNLTLQSDNFLILKSTFNDIYIDTNGVGNWRFAVTNGDLLPFPSTNQRNIGSLTFGLASLFTRNISSDSAQSLNFQAAGTTYWSLNISGTFIPNADGIRDIGTSLINVNDVWARRIRSNSFLSLNSTSGQPISFIVGGVERWRVDSSGSLNAMADGLPIYVGTNASGTSGIFSRASTHELPITGSNGLNGGTIRLFGESHATNANQIIFRTSGSDRWRIESSGHIRPTAADQFNIGDTNRVNILGVRIIQTCDDISVNGGPLTIGPISATNLQFRTSNTLQWIIGSNGDLYTPRTDDILSIAYSSNTTGIYIGTEFGSIGSRLHLYGNSHVFTPGDVYLYGGDSTGKISFGTLGSEKWRIDPNGTLVGVGTNVVINNTEPTIYLQDADSRSAGLHCNSSRFYVLRGSGANSLTFATANGYWPLEIDLETNHAYFGGDIIMGPTGYGIHQGSPSEYFYLSGGSPFDGGTIYLYGSGAGNRADISVAGLRRASFNTGGTYLENGSLYTTDPIELGALGSGDRNSFIDFHSSGTPLSIDYSARIIRTPGVNGNFVIQNTGANPIIFSGALVETQCRIQPDLTNTHSLGTAGRIWSGVHANAFFAYASATPTGLTGFIHASDERLKTNINSIISSKNVIMSLNPVNFVWKESGVSDIGFIAQQVKEIIPEAVQVGDFEEQIQEQWMMSSLHIIPHLTKALQEAFEEIKELKEEIKKLKQ